MVVILPNHTDNLHLFGEDLNPLVVSVGNVDVAAIVGVDSDPKVALEVAFGIAPLPVCQVACVQIETGDDVTHQIGVHTSVSNKP